MALGLRAVLLPRNLSTFFLRTLREDRGRTKLLVPARRPPPAFTRGAPRPAHAAQDRDGRPRGDGRDGRSGSSLPGLTSSRAPYKATVGYGPTLFAERPWAGDYLLALPREK